VLCRRGRTRLASAALAVAVLVLAVPAAPAAGADPPPFASSSATRYQVTFAARGCDSYTAVTANAVRGDPTESPVRPGRDSNYRPGQPVDPDAEAVAGDGCRPLVGWRFTLGSGYQRKGALSVVNGTTVTTTPTVDETARLDAVGHPTGPVLAGAVTGTLTDEQVRLAVRRQLWVQGGTPDDPLLAKAYKGYAFGALRCGIDGHTAGNVQWIGFAPGARHAYCFAYYVHGGPAAGTVTVRVHPSRPVGYPQRFLFQSDLSQAPDGRFAVVSAGDPADASFTRAAGATYNVQPQVPAGWHLAAVTCATTRAGGGRTASTATTDPATGRTTVALAPGDMVTCTYAVDPPPVGAGLTLRVFSENGAGPFTLTVDGPGGTRTLTAAPAGDGNAVPAAGGDLSALPDGTYTVRVAPPAGDTAWTLSALTCGGKPVTVNGLTGTVTVLAAVPQECAARVTHSPGGLRLRVVTAGGVATGGFAVVPADEPATGWGATATTTGYGVPAEAAGDLPGQLPFGGYLVAAVSPASTVDGGWELTGLACTGGQAGAAEGGVLKVTLAAAAPDAVCTASYRLVPSTRLQVVVRAEGAVTDRTGGAVVEVSCTDGSGGRVVLGAQNTLQDALPEALSFLEPASCTITQPSSGAPEKGSVTASALLEPAAGNAPLSLPAEVQVDRAVAEYAVTVTDHFTGSSGGTGLALPHSFKTLPGVLIGIGLFTLGGLILVGLVVRRRAAH